MCFLNKKTAFIAFSLVLLFALPSFAGWFYKTSSSSTILFAGEMIDLWTYAENSIDNLKIRQNIYTRTSKNTRVQKKQAVNIFRFDRGIMWELDPDLFTFRELTMEAIRSQMSSFAVPSEPIAFSFNVETGENREVNGYFCGNIILTFNSAPNPRLNQRITYRFSAWVTPDISRTAEASRVSNLIAQNLGFSGGLENMILMPFIPPDIRAAFNLVISQAQKKIQETNAFVAAYDYEFSVSNLVAPDKAPLPSPGQNPEQSTITETGGDAGLNSFIASESQRKAAQAAAAKDPNRKLSELPYLSVSGRVDFLSIKDQIFKDDDFEASPKN